MRGNFVILAASTDSLLLQFKTDILFWFGVNVHLNSVIETLRQLNIETLLILLVGSCTSQFLVEIYFPSLKIHSFFV